MWRSPLSTISESNCLSVPRKASLLCFFLLGFFLLVGLYCTVVDTITIRSHIPYRLVVMMLEACAGGCHSGVQHAAVHLLLAWQIAAACTLLVLLLFLAYDNACCLPRRVETRHDSKSRRHIQYLPETGAPCSGGGRPENDTRKNRPEK